jgi:hypothetical protein
VDDPFFFDIPAFSRFRASAIAGAADPSFSIAGAIPSLATTFKRLS